MLLQTVHVEGAGVGDQVAAHHRHRNRHLLGDLLDAAGGDDHRFGESRRAQRDVDRRRLTGFEHNPAHGRFEPVQRRFHAVLAGRPARRRDTTPARR